MNLRHGRGYLVQKSISMLYSLGIAFYIFMIKANSLEFLRRYEHEFAAYHLANVLWLSFMY